MNAAIASFAELPAWIRFPLIASCVGLLLGLLSGSLFIGAGASKRVISMEEPWTAREVALDELSALLVDSPNWNRGAEPEPETEPEVEPEPVDPTRPGAFQYLELIAITRSPEPLAVFRPRKMPEALQELMISSVDEVGLIRVAPDTEMVRGWTVAEISDTKLVIEENDGERLVEYGLFDWQSLSE